MSLLRGLILSLRRNGPVDEDEDLRTTRITPMDGSILIRALMRFYQQYEKLDLFRTSVNSAGSDPEIKYGDSTIVNGLYTKAFKSGVDQVLTSFQPVLLNIENEIILSQNTKIEELSEGHLSPLIGLIQEMELVCCHINKIINQIVENKLRGCEILDLCIDYNKKYYLSSIDRLVDSLHRALLRQIKCFVTTGVLQDPMNEFFIRTIQLDETELDVILDTTLSSTAWDISRVKSVCSQDSSYVLKIGFVPSHMPHSMVSNILQIGNLLKLFKKAPSSDLGIPTLNEKDNFGVNHTKVMKMFKDLESKSSINIDELNKVISDIWTILNQHIMKLVVEVGDLYTCQKHIADVYLFQKGDLMRQFLIRSFNRLTSTASNTIKGGVLNTEFQNAADDLNLTDVAKYSDRLLFSLPQKATHKEVKNSNLLKLDYKSPWPLHIIFSQEMINNYNLIFVYLIQFKLTHIRLMNVAKEISKSKTKQLVNGNQIWLLFNRLNQFLTNIENYISVDVINCELNKWETSLKQFKSFDQIKQAHSIFLANILYQLFLINDNKGLAENENNDPYERKRLLIQEEILKIIVLCDSFCQTIEEVDDSKKEDLTKLSREFDERLLKLVTRVGRISRELNSEHSQLLLLRIDYNQYYSNLMDNK